jgi:nucleotide-binding universal stress UspA family protein
MKVLIAVDDQTCAEAIVVYAMANANLTTADIRVISVVPGLMAYTSLAMIPDMMQELRAEARKNAEKLVLSVRALITSALPNAGVSEYVVEGLPAEEILAMAKEWEADMIVVGSHGRHGFSKVLLGSISQAVVSNPPCSVLVVNLSSAEKLCTSERKLFKAGVSIGN